MKAALILTAVVYLSGCAMTYGPRFVAESNPDKASLIYVYRQPTLSGFAMSSKPMLVVDGKNVAKIKNGGYIYLTLEPGSHTAELKHTLFGRVTSETFRQVHFSVESGQVKYFEYAEITTGYEDYGTTEVAEIKQVFMEVLEAFGEKRIEDTRLLDRD